VSTPDAHQESEAVSLVFGLVVILGLLFISVIAVALPAWLGLIFGAAELAVAWLGDASRRCTHAAHYHRPDGCCDLRLVCSPALRGLSTGGPATARSCRDPLGRNARDHPGYASDRPTLPMSGTHWDGG